MDTREYDPHDSRAAFVTDATAKSPVVSVLIPVYNGGRYLAETIDSVLAQTYSDFEVVISDDASTDESLEIISRQNDHRLRLLNNPVRLGFGGNWNRVLNEARGKFIKLLPQDDLLRSDCLQTQVDILQRDTDERLALVFSAREIIGPDGRVFMRRGLGDSHQILTLTALAQRTCRIGTNPIGEPGSVLFRRTAAHRAGLFDGTRPFVIDIDYWLRLLRHGEAAYIPTASCAFRVSTKSHSVRLGIGQAREFSDFLDVVAENFPMDISRTDVLLGKTLCRLNVLARRIFYFWTLRKRTSM